MNWGLIDAISEQLLRERLLEQNFQESIAMHKERLQKNSEPIKTSDGLPDQDREPCNELITLRGVEIEREE
jgi:hypothetical protein